MRTSFPLTAGSRQALQPPVVERGGPGGKLLKSGPPLQFVDQCSGAAAVVVGCLEQAGGRFWLQHGPQDQALAHQRMIDSPQDFGAPLHGGVVAPAERGVIRNGNGNVL